MGDRTGKNFRSTGYPEIMLRALVLLTGPSMELSAQVHPSPILLIHRDILKPGNEAAYREMRKISAPHAGSWAACG